MNLARTLPIAAALALACAGSVAAQRSTGFRPSSPPAHEVPAELQGVDIVERLGESLPLDVPFVDEAGRETTLRAIFAGDRPVILQIGYFKCPMLCNMVLNELVAGLKGVDFDAGAKFDVVAISVNPAETHELAAVKKQGYLLEYGRPGASRGWHFLVGPAESSKAVADAAGFGYRFVPETGEYAHAAAVMICTPDGRLSRYLFGVKYPPQDLRFGLMEASEGRLGSALERFILWCHRYDPDARGYVLFAFRLMKLGGLVTVVLLFGGLSLLWIRDLRRPRGEDPSAPLSPAA